MVFYLFLGAAAWLSAPLAPALAAQKNEVTILAVDYPPFEMKEPIDGLRGFDHEVVVEAFKRKGLTATILFLPWTRAVSDTENGRAPGLLSCGYNEQRGQHYYFSAPISQETYGLFFRRGFPEPPVSRFEDVPGLNLAGIAGYTATERLKSLGAELTEVQTDATALKMLALGRFDYLYSGRQANDFLILRLGMTGIFDFKEVESVDYHLCFSKTYPGSDELLRIFNEGLAEVRSDGTYSRIHAKYRGSS